MILFQLNIKSTQRFISSVYRNQKSAVELDDELIWKTYETVYYQMVSF